MKRRLAAILLLVALLLALLAGTQQGSAKPPPRAPKGFFGIAPQSVLTDEDVRYMKAGGVDAIRWPLPWDTTQPRANGPYKWEAFDQVVSVAARRGLQVLPFVYATPKWISRKYTTMPIDSARARQAWTAFLEAAVKRYGPGGEFWNEHAPGVVQYEPAISRPVPIRTWQLWNEANFFYFAYPASPQRFVRLLKLSSPVIKRADPTAKVVLSGLFGEPTAKGSRGMPAAEFLSTVYRSGTKRFFDGIALHPYAAFTEDLEEMVEEIHEVTLEHHDRVPLYITEIGWGSDNNFNQVAFEQGIRGQVEQLKASYGYLLENRRRLNLKQIYWFSWKDLEASCTFCGSVGLFHEGPRFRAKPAWRAFVGVAGGRARP